MKFGRTNSRLILVSLVAAICPIVRAEAPSVSYIFPAGGQRGTTVSFKVGGHYLYESCPFEMSGPGIDANRKIDLTKTVWFEGPVIPKPDSQKEENYPLDYAGSVKIAADAPLGVRHWQVWNSQGATPTMKFIVGDLPEVVEHEIDGAAIPERVTLPVTINGRVFPREDIDLWSFAAKAGQVITCEAEAARLGSPLEPQLKVLGPSGDLMSENIGGLGVDSRTRFTVPRDGVYSVSIQDANLGGLQHYVYRLTISANGWIDSVYPLGAKRGTTAALELHGANLPATPVSMSIPSNAPADWELCPATKCLQNRRVLLDVDDLPEFLEDEAATSSANTVALPAALNGRIAKPGEVDIWQFEAAAGLEYAFDLLATRLGSSLDSVMTLLDGAGHELATCDDISGGQTDSRLTFKFPTAGQYAIRVTDRLTTRGGTDFAYRLKVTPLSAQPDFRLNLSDTAFSLERGKEAKLKISAERLNQFSEPISLSFEGLPDGVTATGTVIAKDKVEADVVLKANDAAKIQVSRITVRGTAKLADREMVRTGTCSASRGEPCDGTVLLAVTIPTPFRLRAQFEQKFAARGSVYVRHYSVERNGFEGPLTVRLGDRQVRHQQGVTGPTIVVPAGVNEFDYPLSLSTFMEVGRTSRTNLVAIGDVTDKDGSRHKASFSTFDVAEQAIVLTDPGLISAESPRKSLMVEPGKTVTIPVTVGRRSGLEGPMSVRLKVPAHIHGVSADVVGVPSGETHAMLPIHFAAADFGPFNMPLTIHAEMQDARGLPLVAETTLAIVPPR